VRCVSSSNIGKAAFGRHKAEEADRRMTTMFHVVVEERLIQGETRWVAIRARGAEWSWLTPEEAATIGREWVEKYGDCAKA
jgi:hypothetical protein